MPGRPDCRGASVLRWLSLIVAFVGLWPAAVVAEERSWEIRGEFVSLKPGQPETVILRLPDGQVRELPLESFSEANRAAIAAAVKAGATRVAKEPAGAATKEPAATASVLPEALEVDLRGCRTAADMADVYRLFLASEGQPAAAREAAEGQLKEAEERAGRGEVRLGEEWVTADRAAAARREADGHYRQAIEMFRLGNMRVFEEELRRASRADPGGSKAEMLTGLMQLTGPKPSVERALKAFSEAAARDPANGAAWNNVAVCEVQARRFQQAADAFEAAAAHIDDPQIVLDNVGFVIRTAEDRRTKITPKQLEEFTELYRLLNESRGSRSQPPAAGLTYLTHSGVPVSAGGGWDPTTVATPPAVQASDRTATGYAVADGFFIAPGPVVEKADQVVVMGGPGYLQLTGSLVGVTADGSTALVRGEGMRTAAFLPLAAAAPRQAVEIFVFAWTPGQGQPGRASIYPGKLLAPSGGSGGGRFVYEAPSAPRMPGLLVVDASGRLIGFTARTPRVRSANAALGLGAAIDVVWPLLRKDLPDLAAAEEGPAATAAQLKGRLEGTAVTIFGRSTGVAGGP